jgi:hypothetical protein
VIPQYYNNTFTIGNHRKLETAEVHTALVILIVSANINTELGCAGTELVLNKLQETPN